LLVFAAIVFCLPRRDWASSVPKELFQVLVRILRPIRPTTAPAGVTLVQVFVRMEVFVGDPDSGIEQLPIKEERSRALRRADQETKGSVRRSLVKLLTEHFQDGWSLVKIHGSEVWTMGQMLPKAG
jgi:hypothetical protein